MIGLTALFFYECVAEVQAMEPLDFWARIHPDRDDMRFSAHRRRDGSWHLSIEKQDDRESDWSDIRQWGSVLTDYRRNERGEWDPHGLVERVVADYAGLPDAMDWIFSRMMTEELDDDYSPGAYLLDWVWSQ